MLLPDIVILYHNKATTKEEGDNGRGDKYEASGCDDNRNGDRCRGRELEYESEMESRREGGAMNGGEDMKEQRKD